MHFVRATLANGKEMIVPDRFVGADKLKNGYSCWSYLEVIPIDTKVKRITYEFF